MVVQLEVQSNQGREAESAQFESQLKVHELRALLAATEGKLQVAVQQAIDAAAAQLAAEAMTPP